MDDGDLIRGNGSLHFLALKRLTDGNSLLRIPSFTLPSSCLPLLSFSPFSFPHYGTSFDYYDELAAPVGWVDGWIDEAGKEKTKAVVKTFTCTQTV